MKFSKIVIVPIILFWTLSAGNGIAQQPNMQQVIQIYLMQDCGTGEENPAYYLESVISFGEKAVPLLIETVRNGPSKEQREEMRRVAEEDYGEMQQYLKEGGLEGLESSEVARDARELDRETYVAMQMRSYVRKFQERALNALKKMDSPGIIEDLEEIYQDMDSENEFREILKEALDTMKTDTTENGR